jgi:glycolate oxidase
MSYQPHLSEQVQHACERKAFLAELGAILPPQAVLHDEEALKAYECDGLSAYTCKPWLVVLPESLKQVREVLALCNRRGVPVVARGAGTGLSGGALPIANGVLMGLSKLSEILRVDAVARIAHVQPGVRNLAISERAALNHLYYAPDPSSQIACTIGGNIAENAGGVHCLKYGLTVHNLLQVKLIAMDGSFVVLGSHGLDGPGYDLLALVAGSEGMLGVVVEASVRLLPKPPCTQTLLAVFGDVAQAGRAVAAIIAAGLIPAGLEMMDNLTIRAAEAFVQAGYPTDAGAILLCELDGMPEQTEADSERARAVLLAAGALEVRVARDEAERKRFWAGRKAAFPAVGRLSPDYYCMDGTIPRKRLAEVLEQIGQLSEAFGLPVANVFHAGDGNLHPLIFYDANQPGELDKAENLGGKILEACVAAGGTITGEHGVGIEKINQMCVQFSEAELRCFHALKAAFDPQGLLNPGKAIPSLARCAEFGRMHVHDGQLPHSDLERF